MVLHRFHHHNGIVHDQADGQHQPHQADGIDGKAEQWKGDEGAHDRHRNGKGRNQRAAPALEENENHQHHQAQGNHQRADDVFNPGADGQRGVQGNEVIHAGRHIRIFQQGFDIVHQLDGISSGRLVNADGSGGHAVYGRTEAVSFRAQFHAGDISHSYDGTVLPAHHDIFEFLHAGQASGRFYGEGKLLVRRGGLRAYLARGIYGILGLDGQHHVTGRNIQGGHLFRVQPDAHGVAAGSEHLHVSYSGHALDGVHHIDIGVIGQPEAVISPLGGIEADDQGAG